MQEPSSSGRLRGSPGSGSFAANRRAWRSSLARFLGITASELRLQLQRRAAGLPVELASDNTPYRSLLGRERPPPCAAANDGFRTLPSVTGTSVSVSGSSPSR